MNAEIAEIASLAESYYARLLEILAAAPEGMLDARLGPDALSGRGAVAHVCAADGWYLALIRGERSGFPAAVPSDDPEAQLEGCRAAMAEALVALAPAALDEERAVGIWWAPGGRATVRRILQHSLAHKYYHCGQLQALSHALAAGLVG
jgi:uncharacterized damage-inducible protein DinB